MTYQIILTDGTKLVYHGTPSIKDSTILIFSLDDKKLLASFSAGTWKACIKLDLQGNAIQR